MFGQCFTSTEAMLYASGMDLAAHLGAERGRLAAVAAAAGLSPSFLSQVAKGVRGAPAERCVQIEAATDQVVRRWDLRPADWWLIWPELIGVDGAPAVPQPEEVRDAA